jgi:hypothetical protein
MRIAVGLVCVVFGGAGLVGQLVSAIDFRLAQRWGLQEKDDETDPLYRGLELSTARWDLLVIWLLPAAGILMLLDHTWWPFVALAAGGVHVDTGGRELAKLSGLGRQGIRIGGKQEIRVGRAFLGLMILVGLIVGVYALVQVV